MKTTLVLLLSVIALNAADPVRPVRPERPAPITAKSLGKTYVITLRDGTKITITSDKEFNQGHVNRWLNEARMAR